MFILSLEFAIKDKKFQYVYYYYYYSKWLKSKCNKYKLKFSDKSSNKKKLFWKISFGAQCTVHTPFDTSSKRIFHGSKFQKVEKYCQYANLKIYKKSQLKCVNNRKHPSNQYPLCCFSTARNACVARQCYWVLSVR